MEITAVGQTGVPLQINGIVNAITDVIGYVVGGIQDVFPTALQAVLALVLGVAVAFVLKGRIYEFARDADFDERIAASPFAGLFGEDDDAAASAVAAFVQYFLVAVALVVAIGLLNVGVLNTLNQTLLLYAPHVLAAVLVGVVGLAVGRVVYRLVRNALAGRGLSDTLAGTLLAGAVDDESDVLAAVVARAAEFYVYLVALFVAADLLKIAALETVLGAAVFYAPELLAAGAVVVVGVVLASALARVVQNSETAQRTPAPGIVTEATKAFVVLVAGVVALDVAGVDTLLLVAVLGVVVLPLALGLALALALSVGYGSRDFVEKNIDDWT